MTKDVEQLPDDPVLLKRLIVRIRAEAAEQMEALRLRLEAEKKAAIDAILRRFYGPRSESFDPTQLLLFGLAVAPETPVDPDFAEAKTAEAEAGEKLVTRRINHHNHGRRKLPDHLPRRQIVHDLSEQEKKCPCCGETRACIGSQTSEQLEYIPARFEVLQHVRHKYACKSCGEGKCAACDGQAHIDIATREAQPIEKGLPGPGLVAYVVVSKLGDHLPLYRLETIFDRSGIDIARSTMCAWMLAASELVKPLVELMKKRIKQSKVLHTDDTTVKVQDAGRRGTCRTGRIWCYLGDEDNPYDVFDFSPDRKREHPRRFLDDFAGYLQADAYGGYDGIYARGGEGGGVIEVACWAHARRKFFDARETDARRAALMLRMVGRLYAIERAIKARIEKRLKIEPTFTRAEQHAFTQSIRQKRSTRTLAKIKSWLDAEKRIVLPRSPMGQAITYALNQWEALKRYIERGWLNIDNNAAERALKRVAIGRKNWLFAGSDAAGASHARLWTLIASAERHGVDPQRYLTSVLAKIGNTPISELGQFLPEVWKAEDQAEPPTSSAASSTASPLPQA